MPGAAGVKTTDCVHVAPIARFAAAQSEEPVPGSEVSVGRSQSEHFHAGYCACVRSRDLNCLRAGGDAYRLRAELRVRVGSE